MQRLILPLEKPLSMQRRGERLVVWLLPTMYRDILLLREVDGTTKLETLKPPLPPELLGLSRREAEVLVWVAQGKTNGEIAAILGLSPRTVQKHTEHIYQKLEVSNRAAAIIQAIAFLPLHRPKMLIRGA